MGEQRGELDENFHIAKTREFWGLRPWKRHSLILIVGGFLYVLIGALYIRLPPSPGRDVTLKVLLQVAPIQVWGSLFVFSGVLSMLSARWPPFSEKWGYTVLTGMSSGWSATYLLGVLFFGSPALALSQVLVWGVLAFMWWAISGLSNPDGAGVRSDAE